MPPAPVLPRRLAGGLVAAGVLLTACPAVASATDRHVAAAGGSDAGTCVLLACKTVGYAVGQAVAGDRVVVQPGGYPEQVTLGAGRTLVASGAPRATIDGGAGTAVTVTGPGARVEGLRLRGDTYGATANVAANDTAFVGDTFDDTAANPNGKLSIFTGSATVTGNVFIGAPAQTSRGLYVQTVATVDVGDNSFDGFFEAIRISAFGGAPDLVHDNEILGAHGNGQSIGSAIVVGGSATVTANTIGGTGKAGGPTYGIAFYDASSPPELVASAAITRRNRIFGVSSGAIVTGLGVDASTLVSSGDVLTDNGFGFQLFGGHPVVTGATTYGNAYNDIYLGTAATDLVLASSIVGPAGLSASGATCTISSSRGPTTAGGSCERFTTSAAPGFAGPGDFHLTAASPLVDAGDAAAPGPGEVDADGRARAIVGSPAGACLAPRRDIGAYEFVPAAVFACTMPPAPPAAATPPVVAPTAAPTPPPAVAAPILRLTAVTLSRSRLTRRRPATLAFTLSAAARVSVVLSGVSTGRRRGARCVPVTRRNRRASPCTRTVTAGTLRLTGRSGVNAFTIRTRSARRVLRPGRYRLTLTATPAGGAVRTRTLAFSVGG